jgi:hypothetical protein
MIKGLFKSVIAENKSGNTDGLCFHLGREEFCEMFIDYKLYFVLHYYTLTKKNQSRCRSVKKMS